MFVIVSELASVTIQVKTYSKTQVLKSLVQVKLIEKMTSSIINCQLSTINSTWIITSLRSS